MFKYLSTFVLALLLLGCSSHFSKKTKTLSLEKKYAIGSFWNYTETSMAGLKAASIVEGVLSEKKIILYSMIKGDEELTLETNKQSQLKAQIEEAKSLGADYLITGEVQEWRYKLGIDGEPVVSYSLKIIDLNTQKVTFSGIGAKNAWGHQSIGVLAQKITHELLPEFTR